MKGKTVKVLEDTTGDSIWPWGKEDSLRHKKQNRKEEHWYSFFYINIKNFLSSNVIDDVKQ